MNKTEIMNKFTREIHKFGFKIKKHSPELLVVGGVLGTVAGTVMACKATTKLSEVLDESNKKIEEVREYVDKNGYSEKYTEEDSKKDIAILHVQKAASIAKLYAPSAIVSLTSIGCILAGHNILHKRNAALAAAYTIVDRNFKDYRNRVIDRFGKELDRELKYDIKSKEIEETVIDEKTGKEKTVKKTVDTIDPNKYSEFARFFDEGCEGWTKDAEMNLLFLRQQQNYFNNVLKTKGYVFLNEVYEGLGIPKTKAGQVVGWVYDEKNPVGDNFIDFGIYDLYSEKARDFVNGIERTILLDFNVDGEIWTLFQ